MRNASILNIRHRPKLLLVAKIIDRRRRILFVVAILLLLLLVIAVLFAIALLQAAQRRFRYRQGAERHLLVQGRGIAAAGSFGLDSSV